MIDNSLEAMMPKRDEANRRILNANSILSVSKNDLIDIKLRPKK